MNSSLLKRFAEKRVVVLGDLIADEYIFGTAQRISREAPVLILAWQEQRLSLGGAANTAHNIVALGGRAQLVGLVGEDAPGHNLCQALSSAGIEAAIVADLARPTTVKTRILAGEKQAVKQQLVRIDKLSPEAVSKAGEAKLMAKLKTLMSQADALLISDYGLGVLTPQLKAYALSLGKKYKLPVTVDSRTALLSYRGATVLTPNLEELSEALGKEAQSKEELLEQGRELLVKTQAEAVVITLGARGMLVMLAEGPAWELPALEPTQVYDVTGAGDTVIGVLTLALAAGASVLTGAKLANLAAGLVVRKLGTATVSLQELEAVGGGCSPEFQLASG